MRPGDSWLDDVPERQRLEVFARIVEARRPERLAGRVAVRDALSGREGMALYLYAIEHLSHGQTAERMGVARSTVERHLRTAEQKLGLTPRETRRALFVPWALTLARQVAVERGRG